MQSCHSLTSAHVGLPIALMQEAWRSCHTTGQPPVAGTGCGSRGIAHLCPASRGADTLEVNRISRTLTFEYFNRSRCLRHARRPADCHVSCLLAPASPTCGCGRGAVSILERDLGYVLQKVMWEAAVSFPHWLPAAPQRNVCCPLLMQHRSQPCRANRCIQLLNKLL